MCLASPGFQDEEKISRGGRKRDCVKGGGLHTKLRNVCHTVRASLAREAGAYAQEPGSLHHKTKYLTRKHVLARDAGGRLTPPSLAFKAQH